MKVLTQLLEVPDTHDPAEENNILVQQDHSNTNAQSVVSAKLRRLQETWISGAKLKTMTAGEEQNCYHILVNLAYSSGHF